MSTALAALPFAPLLDGDTVASLHRHLVRAGRVLAAAGSSLALAGTLWLILAGPGFLTDGASTAVAGRTRVMLAHR